MTSVADNAAHATPSPPVAPAATPTGSLQAEPAAAPSTGMAPEAASPVKTIGEEGDRIAANAPAAPMMPIETEPEAPAKSISQRVKEAWEYWFGE